MKSGSITVPCIIILLAIGCPFTNAAKCTGGKADLVFLVDGSSSVGTTNFNKTLTFIQNIVSAFEVASDKMRVGMIEFSTEAQIVFHLNRYTDLQSTLYGISLTPYSGRSTNTQRGIELLRTTSMIQNNGGRSGDGVPQIGVIITDGQSDAPVETRRQATLAKNAGIKLMSVCLGPMSLVDFMSQIASRTSYVYKAQGFNQLPQTRNAVIAAVCAEAKGTYSSAVALQSSVIICLSAVFLNKMMRRLL